MNTSAMIMDQPRLACDVTVADGEINLSRDGLGFSLEPDGSSVEELEDFLHRLDGRRTTRELERDMAPDRRKRFATLLEDLDRHFLLDDVRATRARSGLRALLEIEDLSNALMERTLNRNVYWTTILGEPGTFPPNLFHGLAIENYHFLFRESLFDSPILPFVPNTKVRQLVNEFYRDEYGHDEIILRAINALAISREDMQDAMPLPETLALCNALSYWAANDPIFFFATLGILEGKDPEVDVFIEACERNRLDPKFIKPMKAHSDINRKGEHGNLTRLIFKEIPSVDDATMRRMRRQTYLFIQMYDDFYTAIYNHYRKAGDLVRRQSAI